jgi:hypothetical protein
MHGTPIWADIGLRRINSRRCRALRRALHPPPEANVCKAIGCPRPRSKSTVAPEVEARASSLSLVASALAIAERTGASGEDVSTAIVLGYEAAGRITEADHPRLPRPRLSWLPWNGNLFVSSLRVRTGRSSSEMVAVKRAAPTTAPRAASTTLANSTSRQSPVVVAMAPARHAFSGLTCFREVDHSPREGPRVRRLAAGGASLERTRSLNPNSLLAGNIQGILRNYVADASAT